MFSLSKNAFINYCEVLDKDYKEKEEEYNKSLELLHSSYERQQIVTLDELEKVNERIWGKLQIVQSEYIKWFEILIAFVFMVIAYMGPVWLLIFQKVKL